MSMALVVAPGYGGPAVTMHPRGVSPVAPPTVPVVAAHPAHQVMAATTTATAAMPCGTLGSFVPAPTAQLQVPAAAAAKPPSARKSLVEGFPHPEAIERQRQAHSRGIDVQFDQGTQTIRKQFAQKRAKLLEAAEQQKAQLNALVDQQCKAAEAALDDQMQEALVSLKRATLDQRHALEHQAAALAYEYQARKMQDEFQVTQAEVLNRYHESHRDLQLEAARSVQRYQPAAQQAPTGVPPSQYVVTLNDPEAPTGMPVAFMSPTGQSR